MRFHRLDDGVILGFRSNAPAWRGKHVFLPVVLAEDCDARPFAVGLAHPCQGCQSPVAWGRRWCYQLNSAVNADSCKRIQRKSGVIAWEYMGKRLLDRRRKRRDNQQGKAKCQSQRRALAGVK